MRERDGSLAAGAQDLRAPEHAGLGLESRTLTLQGGDDDSLMQDLAELELNAVLNQGATPWSASFKQRLEALLLVAIAPPLCLHTNC